MTTTSRTSSKMASFSAPSATLPPLLRAAALLLLLCGLAVVHGAVSPDAQSDLDDAIALWDSQNIESYSYVRKLTCYCIPEATQPMTVVVVDDVVVDASYVEDGTDVSDDIVGRIPTMNELFDEVQRYIDDDVESLVVTYHPTMGHVTLLEVDRDAMIADDEEKVEVSDLVPMDEDDDEGDDEGDDGDGDITVVGGGPGDDEDDEGDVLVEPVDEEEGAGADDAAELARRREQLNATLHESWELWDSSDVDDYDFVYRRSCYCVPDFRRPVNVRVRDDVVVAVTYADEGDDEHDGDGEGQVMVVSREIADLVPTVNEMFDRIEAMVEEAHMLNVTFDSTYGYPTFIDVDYNERLADDEEKIFLSDLVPHVEEGETVVDDNGGDGDGDEDGDAAKVASERNATLRAAMELWDSSMGSSDYEYEYRRMCFCFPKDTGVLRVVVRGGDVDEVVSVEYTEDDNTTVPTEIAQQIPTVMGLFQLIQDYIDEDADVLNVTYDVQYGYPVEVNVDPDEMRTDDGRMIETGNLKPVTVDYFAGAGGGDNDTSSNVRSGGGDDDSSAFSRGADGGSSPFVASLCLLTVVAAVVLA